MTLADEIARAAVMRARNGCISWSQFSREAEGWRWTNWYRFEAAVMFARGLLDARTPSPNSPATGGRMAQEQPRASDPVPAWGLTMPPLW